MDSDFDGLVATFVDSNLSPAANFVIANDDISQPATHGDKRQVIVSDVADYYESTFDDENNQEVDNNSKVNKNCLTEKDNILECGIGDGNALDYSQNDDNIVYRVEWLTCLLPGLAGKCRCKYSFLVVTTRNRSVDDENKYLIENVKSPCVERQVQISLWKEEYDDMRSNFSTRALADSDDIKPDITISQLYAKAREGGPFNMGNYNSHHMAQLLFNFCLVYDETYETKQVKNIPNNIQTSITRLVSKPSLISLVSSPLPLILKGKDKTKTSVDDTITIAESDASSDIGMETSNNNPRREISSNDPSIYKCAMRKLLLVQSMRSALQPQIKDRYWRTKLYKDCFLRSDAIDWLLENTVPHTLTHAAMAGNELIEQNYVRHVVNEHAFSAEDRKKKLYFVFNDDVIDTDAQLLHERKSNTAGGWMMCGRHNNKQHAAISSNEQNAKLPLSAIDEQNASSSLGLFLQQGATKQQGKTLDDLPSTVAPPRMLSVQTDDNVSTLTLDTSFNPKPTVDDVWNLK